jgi:hypothetical protein
MGESAVFSSIIMKQCWTRWRTQQSNIVFLVKRFCHFHLNGCINKQNIHDWGTEKLSEIIDTPLNPWHVHSVMHYFGLWYCWTNFFLKIQWILPSPHSEQSVSSVPPRYGCQLWKDIFSTGWDFSVYIDAVLNVLSEQFCDLFCLISCTCWMWLVLASLVFKSQLIILTWDFHKDTEHTIQEQQSEILAAVNGEKNSPTVAHARHKRRLK